MYMFLHLSFLVENGLPFLAPYACYSPSYHVIVLHTSNAFSQIKSSVL
jgi:hypothetical protein